MESWGTLGCLTCSGLCLCFLLLKNPTNKNGHIISDTKNKTKQKPSVCQHLHNPAYSPSAKEFTNKTILQWAN